jgi:hypothetical protein
MVTVKLENIRREREPARWALVQNLRIHSQTRLCSGQARVRNENIIFGHKPTWVETADFALVNNEIWGIGIHATTKTKRTKVSSVTNSGIVLLQHSISVFLILAAAM